MKHLLKKTLSLMLSIALCLTCSSFVFAAEAENSKSSAAYTEDKEVMSQIREVIEMFYENKDLGYRNELNKLLDTPILSILEDKADTQQYVTKLYKTSKENYAVKAIALENTKVGKQAHMKFQVITTFNYQNAPDVETEVSEDVYVLYDYDKSLITDFYAPDNYYDIAVRDQNANALEESNLSLNSMTSDIVSKQGSLRNDIDRIYNFQSSYKPVNNNIVSLMSTSLNSNVVTYARNNYNKVSPASGNGSVPYYDFSQIPGNFDCTNFVSHALLAGGANVHDTGGSGISSTGWYYRSGSNRSSSWSGVPQLYDYLVNNTVSNYPHGVGSIYSHNTGAWSTGNILQLRSSGSSIYGHSTIITQKTYSRDGARAYALVTGRTSSTQYNDNYAADDMAPNGSKRTIYVYNY